MKLIKLVPVLSGLAITAMSSLALADIPVGGGGGGCSMATSTPGQLTIASVMFVAGAAALFISRRRKG